MQNPVVSTASYNKILDLSYRFYSKIYRFIKTFRAPQIALKQFDPGWQSSSVQRLPSVDSDGRGSTPKPVSIFQQTAALLLLLWQVYCTGWTKTDCAKTFSTGFTGQMTQRSGQPWHMTIGSYRNGFDPENFFYAVNISKTKTEDYG